MIFHLCYSILPTALLICLENSFWRISSHGNGDFVESFKESFTLYVGSGMRMKTEVDIDIWKNQGGPLVTDEFKAKFCEIIIGHYLCMFLCFYLHSTHLSWIHFIQIQPTLSLGIKYFELEWKNEIFLLAWPKYCWMYKSNGFYNNDTWS